MFTTSIVSRPFAVASSPKKGVNVAPIAASAAPTARKQEYRGGLRGGGQGADVGDIHIGEHKHAVVGFER